MATAPAKRITVTIRPKAGLRDPEGNAILHALAALGWEDVENVHVGKTVTFDVGADTDDAARAEAEAMCRKILANPVIEDYEIVVGDTES